MLRYLGVKRKCLKIVFTWLQTNQRDVGEAALAKHWWLLKPGMWAKIQCTLHSLSSCFPILCTMPGPPLFLSCRCGPAVNISNPRISFPLTHHFSSLLPLKTSYDKFIEQVKGGEMKGNDRTEWHVSLTFTLFCKIPPIFQEVDGKVHRYSSTFLQAWGKLLDLTHRLMYTHIHTTS